MTGTSPRCQVSSGCPHEGGCSTRPAPRAEAKSSLVIARGPGVFTLSFDFELAWGEFHRGRPIGIERLLAARSVFPELLRCLERHRVRATFAVVGHLLLEGCTGHPAMPRPAIPWRPGDWYHGDPESDEKRDPAWYAPSLVRLLKDQAPGHDVGSHGFSHIPLDAPGVSLEVARAEIAESARRLHTEGF